MGDDDDELRGIRQLAALFGGIGALNGFAGAFFLVSGLGTPGCITLPTPLPGVGDCLAPTAYHAVTAVFFASMVAYGAVSTLLLRGRRDRRVRVVGMALLVLLLFNPPLGTVLGAWGLYLFHRERDRFGEDS